MLKSYFFIPAVNSRFIEKMNSLNANEFVFDFEDAVSETDYKRAIKNVSNIGNIQNYWVRPHLFITATDEEGNIGNELVINNPQLEKLFELGFRKFILPKVETVEQLEDIYNVFQYYEIENFEWILLIESPLAVTNINFLLSNKLHPVKGVTLGINNYLTKSKMCFSYERIKWVNHLLLNAAYTFGVEAIDFADTTIDDIEAFKNNTIESLKMGYTAKIIIHPNQLQILNQLEY